MPPVGIVTSQGARRRLKFLRNTAYEGEDYGPGLPAGDTADVDPRWAVMFLQNGRAVELAEGKGPATGKPQIRDPEVEHRDPELPEAKKK